MHINDFEEDEKIRTWLSANERSEIRKACRITVNQMRQGRLDWADEKFCTRGLERQAKRTRDKALSIQAVMGEQEIQQSEKESCDDELIAEAYHSFTTRSQADAYFRGYQDRLAAYPEVSQRISVTRGRSRKSRRSILRAAAA